MANIVNTPITMYVKEHNLELYGDSITELMEYNSYPVKIYSDEELEGCHLVKRHQNSQQLVSVGQLKKDVRRLYRSKNNDSSDSTKRAWWVFLENLNEQDDNGKPLNTYGGVLKTYDYERVPTVISNIDRISNYNIVELGTIKGTFDKTFSSFTVTTTEFKDNFSNGDLKTDFLDIPLPLNEQIEIKIPEVLTIKGIKLDISNSILASIESELLLGDLELENISYDEEEGYYYYYKNTELSKQIKTLIKVRMGIAFYNNGKLYEDNEYKKLKEIEDNIFYYDTSTTTIYKKDAAASSEETGIIINTVKLEDNQEIVEEKEDEENSSFYIQTEQEITVNCSIQTTCKVSENNFNDYFINIDLFLSSLLREEIFTYSYDETGNLTLDWGSIIFEERPFDLTEVLLNETSDDYSNVYTLYSLENSELIEFYSDRYNGAGLNELLLGIRKQLNGRTEYVTNSVSLTVIPSIESDSWFVPVYNIKRAYLGILEKKKGTETIENFKNQYNVYYPQEVDSLYIDMENYNLKDDKIIELKAYTWNPNTGYFELASDFITLSEQGKPTNDTEEGGSGGEAPVEPETT